MQQATPQRRPTIREVAGLAKVSHQTVSRYFRAHDTLTPAVRDRVAAAVEQLNYRPNLIARSMRTRQTGRLAVVIPPLAYNPARMLAGVSAAAEEAGYSLEVVSTAGGPGPRTERVLELSDSGQVDGILSFAQLLPEATAGATPGSPIVVSTDFDDQMRRVGPLAEAGPVVELIEGLATMGHRRFLHVAGSPQFPSARARSRQYEQTIAELGLHSVGIVGGEWTAEVGIEAIRSLDDDNRPTAVIAANDLVAAGVIRGAHERGWRVPEDLSVTGWDNDELGAYLPPSLTTVDMDLERLGKQGMLGLVDVLKGTTSPPDTAPLTHIIWRESTAPPS